jgi:hypothetical protein
MTCSVALGMHSGNLPSSIQLLQTLQNTGTRTSMCLPDINATSRRTQMLQVRADPVQTLVCWLEGSLRYQQLDHTASTHRVALHQAL